ncbi:MAG: two-component regulator propeller domain-containing protein [Kiritimatiellales bacterium]
MASNTILCLQEDREGTLWLGTTAGLQSFRFNRYSGIREGSAYQYMTAITSRKSGGIWFGTSQETLHAIEDGEERQVNKPPVPKGGIRVMLEDHEGVLWANVDNGFLLCLDQNGYRNVFPAGGERDNIWALYEDEQNTLWAGGEKGLWRKDSTGWHLAASEKNGIANIRCIEGDRNGTLWIGMESDGLVCFQNGEFKKISPEETISTDYMTTLHFDQDEKTLWIGTCGNGLLRLRDGQITATFLPQHTVTQIIDDGLSRLWFITEEGVAVVEKKLFQDATDGQETPAPIMIDKNEGVNPTVQIDTGVATACRDTSGNIWIICGKKLLTFRPEQIKRCTDSAQMLIRDVVLNDGVTYAVNGQSSITLPPSVQRMDINFSAFSYFAPSHINFRCRMVGLDSAWVDLGSRRFSSYQHVKPGKYEFEVIASNRDGMWNSTPVALQITVQPHIWETWWFKTGLYIGGTVLIVVFSLGVAERINRRKLILTEKQHAVEQERTRIAMDLHDEIGSELTRLSMLSHRVARAFRRNELDRAPAQVTEMEYAARKLVWTLDEIVWVVSPINDTLDNLIAYISKYVSEFLHEAGIPCETDIPIELPDYQISGPVRHNIFLAVKAAVSNAAKHSNATQITLHVEMLSEMVQITIVDNGKGLTDTEDQRFQNGIKNMRKRMTLVGGEMLIFSNRDKGTTVKFMIPLK